MTIRSAREMAELGAHLARHASRGDVYFLHGDLGAGKTTLAQGFARDLGIDETVQSPTFGLVISHPGMHSDGQPVMLHHLDLYRLEDPAELESIGYGQYLDPDGISVIEWPERAGSWLPDRFFLVQISDPGDGSRSVTIRRVGGQSSPPEP